MTLSMYTASVVPATRTLKALSSILAKAQAHCQARQIDEQAFLSARLFPDMFPMVRQVQIATDMIKGGVSRLAGVEIPRYEDTETSFAELQARVTRTIDYLATFKPGDFDGSDERTIQIVRSSGTVEYVGLAYLTEQVLPNFYFHATTAYNLLRHGGVEIGKKDFLANH
jgi:hypothetical protein